MNYQLLSHFNYSIVTDEVQSYLMESLPQTYWESHLLTNQEILIKEYFK